MALNRAACEAALGRKLAEFAALVEAEKTVLDVRGLACLEHVPSSPGVSWVETTMPVFELQSAIVRRGRKKIPEDARLIRQQDSGFYVVCSGSWDNLQAHLRRQLFCRENPAATRLGCVVDRPPFAGYRWRVSFTVIEDHVLRDVMDLWWRFHVGWPLFCYH